MKISDYKYKNINGLLIEATKVSCVVLPDYGARLQLIYDNETGRQYLTEEQGEVFLPQTIDSVYVNQNVSGADDMFPTIDPIVWHGGKRDGKKYPDHGSVARMPFKTVSKENCLLLETIDNNLSFKYRKTITETTDGFINIKNEITELNLEDFHCYWAFHIMIAGEEGADILTPYKKDSLAKLCFDVRSQFGKRFDEIVVSKQMLTQDAFSNKGNAYKFFWIDKIPEGFVKYKTRGKSLKLTYDKEKLPFVGVWVNNGEFKNLYNTALEIATGPFDSPENSINSGVDFVIKKNETFTFDITVSIE